MNKLKRITKEIEVYNTLYITISKRGYFDYWLDDYRQVMLQVSQTCQVSQCFVKKVYWKKFAIENKEMLDNLEY